MSGKTYDISKHLPDIQFKRLGSEEEAGLWITSLPLPRNGEQHLSLQAQPTFVQPLGQWSGEREPAPRRLLMIADANNSAPKCLSLQPTASKASPIPPEVPSAEMELFERSPNIEYLWERHLLRVRWGGRSVGLALGLRTAGEVHWWEACSLQVLQETPECLVVEMGGVIPHQITTAEDLQRYAGLSNPFLHRHNWLNGRLYMRLHANGVCEVFAHHINSKFVDDGLPLEDAVPVVGIQSDADPDELASLCGEWDGSRDRLELGNVRFDVSEVSRLATPEQPGAIDVDGDFLVWQPYQGMELFGGKCPTQLFGDPYIFRAEDHIVPRGMARTLRFSFSLSDRSPRIARYVAPAWWYGVCEEFLPEPLLPVSNEYDVTIEAARQWVKDGISQGGFEDGSVPRTTKQPRNRMNPQNGLVQDDEPTRASAAQADALEKQKAMPQPTAPLPSRHEPGWEGEIPYAQFLAAWRSGDADDYDFAMRSAYYFSDVVVDHAAKVVRMEGYPPPAIAVPKCRMMGTVAAYLETGDPYLIETAQAVLTNNYWTHKNSWPRPAVGRDASLMRGAVFMYRYFALEHFRQIAHDMGLAVAHVQRADGSFGDQGGGAGIHQRGSFITKPWMGLLAINGVLDYLELLPDEEPFLATVKKFADWLMCERFDRDGVMGWAYQHPTGDQRRHYVPTSAKWSDLPTPGGWYQDNLGRLLAYCSLRFAEPAYLAAWAESRSTSRSPSGDHKISAALQFLPWVQAKLWQATLTENGIHIRPVHFGAWTVQEADILTPSGEVHLQWKDGQVLAPDGVEVDMVEWHNLTELTQLTVE